MAMTSGEMLWVAGGVGAVALGAVLFTLIVRVAGCPGGRHGSAAVGGILAGLLLGPGIAGRVAPDPWRGAFIGAEAERDAYEAMRREHEIEIRAVEEADVTPVYVDELRAAHAAAIAPLRDAHDAALGARQTLLASVGAVLLAIHVLGAGLIAGSLDRMRRFAPWRRASLADALGAAAFMIVLGVIGPALIVATLAGLPAREALAIGLAMSVPAIGIELRPRLLPAAAFGVTLGALGVAWAAGLLASPTLPASIIAGATIALLLLAMRPCGRVSRTTRRALSAVMLILLLPSAVALLTIRCDPSLLPSSKAFWVVGITGVLLAADGRWLGAAWAQKLFPRGAGLESSGARAWTGATSLVNAGTGAAQLAIALLLHDAGIIDAGALAGLILGVAAIETMRTVRARVGWMMEVG